MDSAPSFMRPAPCAVADLLCHRGLRRSPELSVAALLRRAQLELREVQQAGDLEELPQDWAAFIAVGQAHRPIDFGPEAR